MNTNELLNNKKELNNVKDILKDTLQADPKALERLDNMNLDMDAIKTALSFLQNNTKLSEKEKNELVLDAWRINYRENPPSPEEFLTEKYLGPVAKTLYPRVKKTFLDFMNPAVPYRKCILYPFIGFGKSFCSTLITLYIATHLCLMRNPWKFFGLSPASILCQFLCSYSLKKSSELLLEPFNAMLEASPFFERVHSREKMVKANEEYNHMEHIDRIYYTTASPTSELAFAGGSNIKLVSNPQGLLGASVVSAVLSEIAFFIDAGKALYYNELIKMEDGSSKPIIDLKPGDKLYPINGQPNEVEKIMWEGFDEMYEIEMDDGRTIKCNAKHLWKVKYNGKEEVVTTQFMIDHPEIEFEIPEI